MVKRILVEESLLAEIPIVTVAKESSEKQPIVFFVHGFMADKSQGLALGYQLAKLGFYFVSFDAYMHGDRFDSKLEQLCSGQGDYVYPFETGLDIFFLMHEIIVQIAGDIETLITHFDGSSKADTGRIGLTGFSMGGFSTFYVAANNPDIGVAVPIAGIPGFAARWSDVVLEASSYDQWAREMGQVQAQTEKRTAYIEAIDPFEKMTSFRPKPLMMISGDKDIDSPKKYSVDLYRKLKPLYAVCSDRLRLNIHDEAGHQLTSRMIEDTCRWFCLHMLEREDS